MKIVLETFSWAGTSMYVMLHMFNLIERRFVHKTDLFVFFSNMHVIAMWSHVSLLLFCENDKLLILKQMREGKGKRLPIYYHADHKFFTEVNVNFLRKVFFCGKWKLQFNVRSSV